MTESKKESIGTAIFALVAVVIGIILVGNQFTHTPPTPPPCIKWQYKKQYDVQLPDGRTTVIYEAEKCLEYQK